MLEDVFCFESGQTFFAQAYIKELEKRIAQSCITAWESRRPMRIGASSSTVERCSGNRRYLMSDGKLKWQPMDSKNEPRQRVLKEGPEDKHVQVVWFCSEAEDAQAKETVGDIQFAIVNFTAHPANYYGSPHLSADYPGVIRKLIKDWIGDIPVMFLQGCLGNIHCINFDRQDWFKNASDRVSRIGRVLGAEAVKQMLSGETRSLDELPMRFASRRLPLPYRTIPGEEMAESLAFAEKARQGELKVPHAEKAATIYRNNLLHRRLKTSDHNPLILDVLRVGDVIFATNPAELFVEFQLEMRQRLAGKMLVACSCTNGHAFYVPTRKAHVFGGYETLVCQLDPDAGEKIVAATIELVNRLESG